MARFNLEDYATVEERLKAFWSTCDDARIVTVNHTTDSKLWIIEARIYLTAGDQANNLPKATGYAEETDGTGGANNGSALENAETSAIGRALANMNLSGNKRTSRQEMQKVEKIANTDWIAEANAITDVNALRQLYTRARAQGAPSEVLEMVKARAESLDRKDS